MKKNRIRQIAEDYRTRTHIVGIGIPSSRAKDSYILNMAHTFFANRGGLQNPNYSWHRVAMVSTGYLTLLVLIILINQILSGAEFLLKFCFKKKIFNCTKR